MKLPSQLIWLPTGGHIGDAVMVTSLFAEITSRDSSIRIKYLIRRNAAFISELTKAYPAITAIPVSSSPFSALKAVLPLFVRRSIVIAPPPWGKRPLILKILAFLFFLRRDVVVAFDDGGMWRPYGILIAHDKRMRYIDNLRSAVTRAGLSTAPSGSPPHLSLVTTLPASFPFAHTPYIVVHPFPHMSKAKTIPLRRWKHALQELHRLYPNYGVVVTGAEVDRKEAEELRDSSSDVYLAINLTILEVAGLIKHATLYLGVDTGPTHIAGVLHVPSVVLAQQKDPMWLPTYNPNAICIWEKKNCVCGIPGRVCAVAEDGTSYRRCVYDISDKALFSAIDRALVARTDR